MMQGDSRNGHRIYIYIYIYIYRERERETEHMVRDITEDNTYKMWNTGSIGREVG
jgi:hypothetical protein